MERLVLKHLYIIVVPLFGAAFAAPNKGCATFAAPNKGTTVLSWFRFLSTVLIPTENRKFQGHFKAFAWFSSTFQGIFNFQILFKKALLNSITFKPIWTLMELVIFVQILGTLLLWQGSRQCNCICPWVYETFSCSTEHEISTAKS